MSEAEATNWEKNKGGEKDGSRLQKTLAKMNERKGRIRKCLADLEAKAEKRTEREEISGLLRGRNPKEAQVDPEALKANTTDPESRIMRIRKEGYLQAHNAQIVETEDQIIVGAEITQEANDQHQLLPMLEATQHTLKTVGIDEIPREVVADTVYGTKRRSRKSRWERRSSFSAPSGKPGDESEKMGPNRRNNRQSRLKRRCTAIGSGIS